MTYSAAEGRTQILDDFSIAIEYLGDAVATLSTAYELLDEHSGDRMEASMFRPVQQAFGSAQRVYSAFAARYDLPTETFREGHSGPPSAGAKALLEQAADSAALAETRIAELQDSMLPVEVGDAELRAGLAEVRTRLDHVRDAADALQRTFGR